MGILSVHGSLIFSNQGAMSRAKLVTPGSPFQFRALGQHLMPLLKDVKTANLSFNPGVEYSNNGLVYAVAKNISGRITARLCPKTVISFTKTDAPATTPAKLSVEYLNGVKADYPITNKYKTMRDVSYDLYLVRTRMKLLAAWEKSLTYMSDKGDDSAEIAAAAKKKKGKK